MNPTKLACIAALTALAGNANAMLPQERANWCWAASAQDVLEQFGIRESQPSIVARLAGWPQDRPATSQELSQLLGSYGLRAWEVPRPGSPAELFNTLSSGWKLIAFVRPSNGPVGHFIVLEGIAPRGNVVAVSDPSDGSTRWDSLQHLYYGWRWGESVVVGAPTNTPRTQPGMDLDDEPAEPDED